MAYRAWLDRFDSVAFSLQNFKHTERSWASLIEGRLLGHNA